MATTALMVALLVLLLILYFVNQQWMHRLYPPGPLALPFIGSMWKIGTRFHADTLIQLAKQYGNIYTIWLGSRPIVVLSGFRAVKEGMVEFLDEFSERPLTPSLKAMGKEKGIIFSNGPTWKQQRRFIFIIMHKLGLGRKVMEQQIEEEAQQLVETFAHAKGQPLDPALPVTNSVSNIICALTFGYRFSLEDKNFQKLVEAVNAALKFTGSFFHILYETVPWLMKHLPGPHKKALSEMEVVLSFAKKEIEKHKERQSLYEPCDFIDFYLLQTEKQRTKDPNSPFNEENLAQCIHDFFIAGTETTAVSLKWALLLLTSNPDIQDKVYKEMEDVLASSGLISYQDHKRLPYTNAVIHEMQRVRYALLLGVPRQCAKNVNMHGFLIPKGTQVWANLRSVLLDPERWETPEEFNPNHFLDKEGKFVVREEYLPFGAGARVCLGEQLARTEIFIFLANLLRIFHFQLPEGVKELNKDPIPGMSTHPHPYKICAVPRNHSL